MIADPADTSPSRAAERASALAAELADPAATSVRCLNYPPEPQSLANGAAGIALLHIERARTGHGDWPTAYTWLATAARGQIIGGEHGRLFLGAPALAYLAHQVTVHTGQAQRLAADLHAATVALTSDRLATADRRIDQGRTPTLAEFDLLRGLTGLAAYHLSVAPDHELTGDTLRYLVRLTEPLSSGLPGWWTHHDPHGQTMPGGHANNSISHGIAGPLAVLSLAMLRGVVVPGHVGAIGRICAWLDSWQQSHPAGPWWPRWTTSDGNPAGVGASHPGQPSWCYGTPGLARALQLAGLATGNPHRQRIAETALLGCLTDPTQLDLLDQDGLCHGLAGLLIVTTRMAADAATPELSAHCLQLTTRLTARQPGRVQGNDLLNGTSGIALALHTATAPSTPRSTWDACLLLT
jgi:hypothetical protein